ncbi:cathelicidin-3-like [Lathamus discolor]|uniref:cathelicidin-3-like n=1 Tax=Lathamus discolor TaxID=678569 RepID=UPI0032B76443
MPSSWALVLVVLGGACALPAPAPLAYTQALAQAVSSYNQRPEVQNSFRLLSADPEPAPVSGPPQGPPHRDPRLRLPSADPKPMGTSGGHQDLCMGRGLELSSLQRLNFTITETQCLACSRIRPGACEFKEDRLVKDCSAPEPQRGGSVLGVTCRDTTTDPVRVKRFWPLLVTAIRTVAAGVGMLKSLKG